VKSNLIKKILYALAGLVILLILVVQSPVIGGRFSYLPVFLMPAVIAAAIMLIATFIYDMIKKTKLAVNFLLLLLVLLGAFWLGLKIIDMQIYSTKNASETIIVALDKYYFDNDQYPGSLERLKPKYIDEVPKSKLGIIRTDFDYNTLNNNGDYRLSFAELFNTKWTFVKSRDSWMMDK
jgi:hypothetical protein